MKKIAFFTIFLGAIFCSCESNGPKNRYNEDTRTSEEMLQDISDASEGDGWLHKYEQMCTMWKMANGNAMAV